MSANADIIYIGSSPVLPSAVDVNWEVTVPPETGKLLQLVINGGSPISLGTTIGSGVVPVTGLIGALTVAFFNGLGTTYDAVVALDFSSPVPSPGGQGDIPNPGAWEDASGNIPPLSFQNVPQTVNFPRNGDGRYWFTPDAFAPTPDPITFIGDSAFRTDGIMALQTSITQAATDGSSVFIAFSTDGTNFTQVQIGPSLQGHSLLSHQVLATLSTLTTALVVKVFTTGGVSSASAKPWQVAVAITRNANEHLAWDYPNPFNPISYNCECVDEVVPTETLLQLRTDILTELGFATQAASPPPGMAALVNSWLSRGQKYLYRRYNQLHTRRMFRWKVNPGQRFYSLKDNDEDVLCNYQMDPLKTIEWAGIQDSRNVWYPLVEGIQPQLYTMIDKPWRPARYEIRQCIELYPAPDQTYWLWMKAHFGLRALVADTDSSTIDATLLFLHTLAVAKAHYGKPDANNVQAMANAYRKELIAGTHGTKKYIPGATAIPPAIRPTLIQFQ
jgi:hypothetical protein